VLGNATLIVNHYVENYSRRGLSDQYSTQAEPMNDEKKKHDESVYYKEKASTATNAKLAPRMLSQFPPSNNLYFSAFDGNVVLNRLVRQEAVFDAFSRYGQVEHVKVLESCGFVKFYSSKDTAQAVYGMNRKMISGLEIRCNYARGDGGDVEQEVEYDTSRRQYRSEEHGHEGWKVHKQSREEEEELSDTKRMSDLEYERRRQSENKRLEERLREEKLREEKLRELKFLADKRKQQEMREENIEMEKRRSDQYELERRRKDDLELERQRKRKFDLERRRKDQLELERKRKDQLDSERRSQSGHSGSSDFNYYNSSSSSASSTRKRKLEFHFENDMLGNKKKSSEGKEVPLAIGVAPTSPMSPERVYEGEGDWKGFISKYDKHWCECTGRFIRGPSVALLEEK